MKGNEEGVSGKKYLFEYSTLLLSVFYIYIKKKKEIFNQNSEIHAYYVKEINKLLNSELPDTKLF